MIGDDICGFLEDTSDEICARWIQSSFLNPFLRNHNHEFSKDQSFDRVGTNTLTQAKSAIKLRYTLLKFLYSLFLRSSGVGTIIKPLFFDFPESRESAAVNPVHYETQFIIGKEIMVAAIVDPSASSKTVYFPANSKWFVFYSGESISCTETIGSKFCTKLFINLPNEKPLVFIKSGAIVPIQNSTLVLRTHHLDSHFSLLVALGSIDPPHTDCMFQKHIEDLLNVRFTGRAHGFLTKLQDYSEENVHEKCIRTPDSPCLYSVSVNTAIDKNSIKIYLALEDLSSEENKDLIFIDQLEVYGVTLPLTIGAEVLLRGKIQEFEGFKGFKELVEAEEKESKKESSKKRNLQVPMVMGKLEPGANCKETLLVVFQEKLVVDGQKGVVVEFSLGE